MKWMLEIFNNISMKYSMNSTPLSMNSYSKSVFIQFATQVFNSLYIVLSQTIQNQDFQTIMKLFDFERYERTKNFFIYHVMLRVSTILVILISRWISMWRVPRRHLHLKWKRKSSVIMFQKNVIKLIFLVIVPGDSILELQLQDFEEMHQYSFSKCHLIYVWSLNLHIHVSVTDHQGFVILIEIGVVPSLVLLL